MLDRRTVQKASNQRSRIPTILLLHLTWLLLCCCKSQTALAAANPTHWCTAVVNPLLLLRTASTTDTWACQMLCCSAVLPSPVLLLPILQICCAAARSCKVLCCVPQLLCCLPQRQSCRTSLLETEEHRMLEWGWRQKLAATHMEEMKEVGLQHLHVARLA